MKAVKFQGNGKVSVEQVPDPVPDDKSIIVKVHASALCGSELYTLKYAHPQEHMGDGFNTGHEVAGEVQWAPKGSPFKPGMHVGARVVQGCGTCAFCKAGDETACANKVYYAANGHSQLFKLGLQGVQVLPPDVAWPEAAVLSGDGLGVPVRAARRLGNTAGKKVLVIGLGPVGLSCALVQIFGGAQVAGIDMAPYRLDLAKKLGAEQVFDASKDPVAERVSDWTGGLGPDVVIVAVAREDALRQAFELVRRHGTVFLVGELEEAKLNFSKSFLRREATLMGSWYYTSEDWPLMLDLHKRGLPYKNLITHVVPLDRAQEGFDAFAAGKSGKVVLTMDA